MLASGRGVARACAVLQRVKNVEHSTRRDHLPLFSFSDKLIHKPCLKKPNKTQRTTSLRIRPPTLAKGSHDLLVITSSGDEERSGWSEGRQGRWTARRAVRLPPPTALRKRNKHFSQGPPPAQALTPTRSSQSPLPDR